MEDWRLSEEVSGWSVVVTPGVYRGEVSGLEKGAQVGEQAGGFKEFLKQEEGTDEEDGFADQEKFGEDDGDSGSHVRSNSWEDLVENSLRFGLNRVVLVVNFVGDGSDGFSY